MSGLGLAAYRDMASWVKYAPDAVVHAPRAIGFGSSQSGRFLRTFLYYGFNADEQGRQVLDGAMVHIAGAARLSINERGAQPTALSMYPPRSSRSPSRLSATQSPAAPTACSTTRERGPRNRR